MKNYKLKPSVCIASPDFCKNICPPDINCGMRRFINKYGFNYLPQEKPNPSSSHLEIHHELSRNCDDALASSREKDNLEEILFIGSKI